VYSDTGRYAEAEALYERVRAIYEKALGPEHPWTATTLANLACVYRDTGRYADAEQLLAVALRLFSTKLPPRHPRIARLLVDRGKLHAACGRKREAADDFSVALADFAAAGVRPDYRWVREARAGLASLGDG
jgi:tetratricopeptide (TPR) repeat protein